MSTPRLWLKSALLLLRSRTAATAGGPASHGPMCLHAENRGGLAAGGRGDLTGMLGCFRSSSGFHAAAAPWATLGLRNSRAGVSMNGHCAPVGLQVETRRAFASKLKHPKIKAYSSYKLRFRPLANGLYKRWKAGKRHNAHSKSNKQQRQLRIPSVAPPGLAKAMKYLNFQG